MAGADSTLSDRPAARVDLPTSLVGTLLVLVLVALHIANPAVVEAFRVKMFDELQQLHPRPRQEAVPIAIVDIDDASLAEVGQWPWPRSTMGELVRRLNELGARVVTCDVLFAESDRYSPPVYAREVEALDPELAAALRELPDNDARMAAAMAGGGGRARGGPGRRSPPVPA
jgi:adenylate cyclase